MNDPASHYYRQTWQDYVTKQTGGTIPQQMNGAQDQGPRVNGETAIFFFLLRPSSVPPAAHTQQLITNRNSANAPHKSRYTVRVTE